MGRQHLLYLDQAEEIYVCVECDTHLTQPSDVVSKVSQNKSVRYILEFPRHLWHRISIPLCVR
jgi:hypothetical protein